MPFRPAAMILLVQSLRGIGMPGNLVDALPAFGIGVGYKRNILEDARRVERHVHDKLTNRSAPSTATSGVILATLTVYQQTLTYLEGAT